ncbi:Bug family tripartite tricarboxylate transporter substrate binding protein [Lacisediminimonas profundi]|uniref:Bug family tripartite tricarboxylate transporter substrate binding protein n=1 Tax=Lacisediminimonas profundi TaxID=2603856 RepID=UPI00140C0B34|nr:tripartite tricarboxylate transporter substrate binding protein [Lacisediminimonas profundi]
MSKKFNTKRINASRRTTLFAALACAFSMALPAQAQDAWPSKPIRLVLGFAAGGGTDVIARGIAQKMGESLGTQVVVDNKPGANGNIANELVAKSPADGYTLVYNTSSIVLSPALYPKLNYDVNRDMTPVALTANLPIILVASPKLPAKTAQELVAMLKANPGKMNYASAGNGNITHLSALLFLNSIGLTATHVPYRSEAPAITDVAGGQVDFYMSTAPGAIPLVKDKRVNALAVSTLKRMDALPEVPTLSESVSRGLELGAWSGIMAPAGTSPEIIAKLNVAIKAALTDKDLAAKFAVQGGEAKYMPAQQYGAFLKSELARWDTIVKKNNVKMD